MKGKIVAGMDEAGLGPRLGPLVVSAAVFETRHGDRAFALERLLEGVVTRGASARREGIPLDDSKRLYPGPGGAAVLERAALSFFHARHDRVPDRLGEWLEALMPAGVRALARCPWYGPDPAALPLPRFHAPEAIARLGDTLRERLAAGGARVRGLLQEVVLAPELNRRIERLGNKGAALSRSYENLFSRITRDAPEGRMEVDVDKLGGRAYYAGLLHRVFPGRLPAKEEEGRARSVYRLARAGGALRVRFLRRGDGSLSHVALASILSKYTRELYMELFNRFWRSRLPGLRPTAGYPLDARRFLAQIAPAAREFGPHPWGFIRTR